LDPTTYICLILLWEGAAVSYDTHMKCVTRVNRLCGQNEY
jgi:hypothetical protein